ncbi:hypothetical protein RI367_005817 [Sorochytrium milnesiophthora]
MSTTSPLSQRPPPRQGNNRSALTFFGLAFYHYIPVIFPETPSQVQEFRDREIKRVRAELGLESPTSSAAAPPSTTNADPGVAAMAKGQQRADVMLAEMDAAGELRQPLTPGWTADREQAIEVIKRVESRGKWMQERWQDLLKRVRGE